MARRSMVMSRSIVIILVISSLLQFVLGGTGDLTARKPGQEASIFATNQPPVAVASANPTTVEIGWAVYFSAWDSTDDDSIASCTWNYSVDSQGVYLYGIYPVQTFNRTGSFIVTLTVMDFWGLSSSDTVQINVTPPVGPYLPMAEAGLNRTISFDEEPWLSADGSYGSIIDYLWTFNVSGVPVRLWGRAPHYVIGVPGTYVLTLTVTDWYGQIDSDNLTLKVVDFKWPGKADAGPDQTAVVGEEVTFNGSGSQAFEEIASYSWSFFDGYSMVLQGVSVTHTFVTPGDIIVWLRVEDALGNAMGDLMMVRVQARLNSPPYAEAGSDANIQSGTTFQFNASGSTDDEPGLEYLWNFVHKGTHVILQGVSPVFQFTKIGTYLVNLTVTDTGGLSDSDTVTITVTNSGEAGKSSFLEKYGVWLVIVGAEAALVALGALVVIKRRGTRKN